jgi:hypothetical protein
MKHKYIEKVSKMKNYGEITSMFIVVPHWTGCSELIIFSGKRNNIQVTKIKYMEEMVVLCSHPQIKRLIRICGNVHILALNAFPSIRVEVATWNQTTRTQPVTHSDEKECHFGDLLGKEVLANREATSI